MSTDTVICDFCSSNKVITAFHAKDVELIPGVLGSLGEWAACLVCRDLILAEDWNALLERSVDTFKSDMPMPVEFIREALSDLHKKFREARLEGRTEVG